MDAKKKLQLGNDMYGFIGVIHKIFEHISKSDNMNEYPSEDMINYINKFFGKYYFIDTDNFFKILWIIKEKKIYLKYGFNLYNRENTEKNRSKLKFMTYNEIIEIVYSCLDNTNKEILQKLYYKQPYIFDNATLRHLFPFKILNIFTPKLNDLPNSCHYTKTDVKNIIELINFYHNSIETDD